MSKHKAKVVYVAVEVPRIGPEAAIGCGSRKTFIDTLPAWMRTRKGRNDRAIRDSQGE